MVTSQRFNGSVDKYGAFLLGTILPLCRRHLCWPPGATARSTSGYLSTGRLVRTLAAAKSVSAAVFADDGQTRPPSPTTRSASGIRRRHLDAKPAAAGRDGYLPYAFSAALQILLGQTGASTLKIFDRRMDKDAGSRKLKETEGNSALSPDGRLFASGDPFAKLQWAPSRPRGSAEGQAGWRNYRRNGALRGRAHIGRGRGPEDRLLNTATGEVRLMRPAHPHARFGKRDDIGFNR